MKNDIETGARASPEKTPCGALEQAGSCEAAARPEALEVPRRRILLVDDNVDALASLSMLLELDGHEVRTAETGLMALQVATSWPPDVGLLDIGLPGMDGYELARRMRTESRLSELRLIAITGSGHSDDRTMALAAGFDEHLVKPVPWEVLLEAIA